MKQLRLLSMLMRVAGGLLLPAIGLAHGEDLVIESGAQFRDWCRSESAARFVARTRTPYNWSARYWAEGNILHVEGSWQVEGREVRVSCHVAKGAQARYAALQIGAEPEAPEPTAQRP